MVTRLWRAATLLWMVAILVGSLLPRPGPAPGGTGWHVAGYAVLGALGGRWLAAWLVWLLATGYGALIEGLQWLVRYRSAELSDLMADAVGALVGLIFSGIWTGLRRRV